MLITDSRVILNTDADSYQQEDTFIIKDILWLAVSAKNKKSFLICVKNKPTFYFSVKRREEAVVLLKILYFRLSHKPLDIYDIPSKDLSGYVVGQKEASEGNYKTPEGKYLHLDIESDDEEEKAIDR